MNCMYCKLPCSKWSNKSEHFRCIPCEASFYMKDNELNSVDLFHQIGEKRYTVNLLYYCNKSIISYTQPVAWVTSSGLEPNSFGTLLEVNNILPITPRNFRDKLKTYLLFS